MNEIISTGSFPEPQRKAVVISINNKENKYFAVNYMPISFTSAPFKFREKIIFKQLTEFFFEVLSSIY